MSGVTPLPGFEEVRDGRVRFLVRSDVRAWLVPLLRAAGHQWTGYAPRPLSGGRGGAQVVAAHAVVVRPCRRGGLPARLLHDTHFGWTPRPFRELRVTETLRQRGGPVVEVYGAAVEWLLPGCYRGWVATRYMHGARTLWEWATTPPPAPERSVLWEQVGKAVHRLHACGVRHPDLNANNILLCPAVAPALDVLFIDFDRARMDVGSGREPEADLDRLWRSLRKLDPQGRYASLADFALVRAAYREESVCA